APITTRFRAPPRIDDETLALYDVAVRDALTAADPNDARWRTVLDHVDNDTGVVAPLLADLLAKRDQWLRHLMGRGATALRAAAEATLIAEIESELVRAQELFPTHLIPELVSLARYAAGNLAADPTRFEHAARMESCAARGGLPDANAVAIADWQTLAGWLLTREGEWRKSFAERDGVPPKSNGAGARERELFKTRMAALVEGCATVSGLREAL